MTSFSRRRVLGTGAGVALGATLAAPAWASSRKPSQGTAEETRSLDELYADALREGGELVVYAGGDTPDQQQFTQQAFLSRFPAMKLTMVVDYSKYHDVRVDNQLATGTLVPDVVQLQTVQDFVRWKEAGVLRPYRPAGSSALYPAFRDPDGAWTGISVIGFSYMYDAGLSAAPASPRDFADPRWKGAIASSYPHDDDAVLYLYRLYVKAYGWEWVERLATQQVQFARGSHTPGNAVASKARAIGIGGAGSLAAAPSAAVRWAAPDGHPFMAWAQRAAILAGARHLAAAKLYLNWQVSRAVQENTFNGWSVRTDVRPPSGLRPIWQYANANLGGFPRFMADRAEVERWKQTFALYFGEVQGPPTPGSLGLHPGR